MLLADQRKLDPGRDGGVGGLLHRLGEELGRLDGVLAGALEVPHDAEAVGGHRPVVGALLGKRSGGLEVADRVVELVEAVGGPRLVDDVLGVALGRHVAILGARAARERDREAHREEGRESEMKSHGMHPFSGKPDHRLPLCRFPPPASSTKLGPDRRDGGGRIFPMIGNIFSIHWKIAENFFQSLEKTG